MVTSRPNVEVYRFPDPTIAAGGYETAYHFGVKTGGIRPKSDVQGASEGEKLALASHWV